MSTKSKLDLSLKEAMKSHDELRKRTLRMALSAIRMAEIDKRASAGDIELPDVQVQAIVQREIKTRQEALEEAQRANRPELADAARAEIAVLEEFLPRQLTPEELDALARQAVEESGATSIKEMGMVMKLLMPRLQGRAAGDQASQAVKRLLGS